MNLSLASLFSFGARQFEKKDSFFFKWPLIERLSGYSYQQGICLSVRPSVEALLVHTLFLS